MQGPLPTLFSFQHHIYSLLTPLTLLAFAAEDKDSLDFIAISPRPLVCPVSISDLSFDGAIPGARSALA